MAGLSASAATGRHFVKMHGLRNHFVIVDARTEAFTPDDEEIIRICDPEVGVGAEQLIVIDAPRDSGTDAFMRILNVDAREVEACGNATRCVAWLLMEEAGTDTVTIETLAGLLECERRGDMLVSCSMGRVSMDWRDVPLAEERDTCHLDIGSGPLQDAVALNVGNPHAVFFVDDLDDVDLAAHAPSIQKLDIFPDEVNVGAAQMTGDDSMRLAVYERGAGLTTACGSGACAAVYAALARGLADARTMTVRMPAGSVEVGFREDGHAVMTGPVAHSFHGYL